MLHINFYYIKIFYTLLTSFKLSFIFVFQCKIDRDRNSLRIQCNVAIHHSFLTRGKISIFVQKIYLYKGTGQQGQERRDRAAGTGMQGQGRRGTGLQWQGRRGTGPHGQGRRDRAAAQGQGLRNMATGTDMIGTDRKDLALGEAIGLGKVKNGKAST